VSPILLVALASAWAQGRSPNNLQVHALGQGLTAPVTLRVSSGGRDADCALADDGTQPADMHAGDGVWSCDLVLPGQGPWTLRMSWGGRTAVGVLASAPDNQPVFLSTRDGRIEARTDIVFVPMERGSAPAPAGVPVAGAGAAPATPATSGSTSAGTGTTTTTPAAEDEEGILDLWGAWVALGALAGALALPILLAPRAPRPDPRPPGTAPYARLPREALVEQLVALYGTHRVVALGPARLPAVELGDAQNAGELVALAAQLADGPLPVAIVVTDLSLLEPIDGDPWAELVAAARGRYAVYGPAETGAGGVQAMPPSNRVPTPSMRETQDR